MDMTFIIHQPIQAFLLAALIAALTFSSPLLAQEKLLVIGGWDYGEAVFAQATGDLGMSVEFVETEATGALDDAQLEGIAVVFLLNLKPAGVPRLQGQIARMSESNPNLKVLALDNRESQLELEKAGLLIRDPAIREYWRYNGLENTKRMLTYVRVKHLGGEGEIRPPIVVPDHGFFHPSHDEYFDEASEYLDWAVANSHFDPAWPNVALLVQQSFLVTGDTKVYAALLAALEKRKLNAVVIFARNPADKQALLDAWKPDLLLDDAHASPSILDGAAERDIPILKPVELLRSTVAEWASSVAGMRPADVGLHFLTQEIYGIIDPVVVSGLKANVGGYKLHEPIPERVERMADRAARWIHLRQESNADKKVAIVYYNTYLGKSDVGRGSATGAFLDGPASLYRLLVEMKEQGYSFSKFPRDADELLTWMQTSGRNVGVWAENDLAAIVHGGDPILISVDHYAPWFDRLSDANRKMVESAFGPVPGKQMVWSENGVESIVIPRIDLGNVVLLPQPARGPENDIKLLHARDVPPPHQYLACYWWLQEDFRADAVIHFGTHGTEFLLPGKSNGLSKDCFGDICLGSLPNIYPWIIDNVAEAIQAKRRASAVTVDHLTPPLESAGLSDELRNLHSDIEKFLTLDEGLLRNKYRRSISRAARKAALLGEQPAPRESTNSTTESGDLSDHQIEQLELQLHEIELSVTAISLHVLGVEPPQEHLIPFLSSMLGRSFLDKLADVLPVPDDVTREHRAIWARSELENLVRQMLENGLSAEETLQLAGATIPADDPEQVVETLALVNDYRTAIGQSDQEIGNILRALDGKFIRPGPGSDPVRNPGAIPTGRNMYSLNPEEVPTREAWEVGMQLVDQLLNERPELRKVAFDMNAFETMRDYGVSESQALYLMGVRPVWDLNNLAVDVEIIPRDELKRPRVDVFIAISGTMRDNFSSRVKLLDKAIRLVSELDEPGNLVREGTQATRQSLEDRGFSPQRVAELAPARIFGARPGDYGTRILYLIPKTGAWENRSEIADVYKRNMSYVFTGDLWGEEIEGLYDAAASNTELVMRTWTSNMTGPLTNHHVYEYAGGLSLAIEQSTGRQPDLMFNDVRGEPKVRDFNEILSTEAHVTMLNPKWLRGMMENGYSGAGMMAEVVRNAAGWEATREGSISNSMWNEIHDVYINDKHSLALNSFMEQTNPHAFQEIAAVLLEANRKEFWQTDSPTIQALAKQYARSVVRHGKSNGLTGGGNEKLSAFVDGILSGVPDEAELLTEFRRPPAEPTASAAAQPSTGNSRPTESAELSESEQVVGNALVPNEPTPTTKQQAQSTGQTNSEHAELERTRLPALDLAGLFAVALLALFAIGFIIRSGGPRC